MSKIENCLASLHSAWTFKYLKLHVFPNYHNKFPSQWGDHVLGACMYKEKFFLLEGQLYQERLVFNCFKNIIKRCLENKENAYSTKKNPRASRALRRALDPSPLKLTSFTWLHFALSATWPKIFLGPPTSILGPPLAGLPKGYVQGNMFLSCKQKMSTMYLSLEEACNFHYNEGKGVWIKLKFNRLSCLKSSVKYTSLWDVT